MITKESAPREVGRPRVYANDDVFAATARVVTRLGYARFTVNAVAAELGCTAPALIRRFGSKRGLVLAYIEWSNAASRERFRRARETYASPLAALRARFRIPTDRRPDEVADPAGYANLVGFHLAAWADPGLREAEKARRELFEAEIASLLEAAHAGGELVACDARRLGRTLLAALTGVALQWAADADRAIEARLVETIDEIVAPYRAPNLPGDDRRQPARLDHARSEERSRRQEAIGAPDSGRDRRGGEVTKARASPTEPARPRSATPVRLPRPTLSRRPPRPRS